MKPQIYTLNKLLFSNPSVIQFLLKEWNQKKTAKGVVQGEQKKISHQNYRDIHDRIMKSINTKYSQIRPFRSRIFTIESQKTSLVKFDSKRYWIDGNKSVAFGSPRIKSLKAKSSMKKNERLKKKLNL